MSYVAYAVLVGGSAMALFLAEKPLSSTVVSLALFGFNMAAIIFVLPALMEFFSRLKDNSESMNETILTELKDIKARVNLNMSGVTTAKATASSANLGAAKPEVLPSPATNLTHTELPQQRTQPLSQPTNPSLFTTQTENKYSNNNLNNNSNNNPTVVTSAKTISTGVVSSKSMSENASSFNDLFGNVGQRTQVKPTTTATTVNTTNNVNNTPVNSSAMMNSQPVSLNKTPEKPVEQISLFDAPAISPVNQTNQINQTNLTTQSSTTVVTSTTVAAATMPQSIENINNNNEAATTADVTLNVTATTQDDDVLCVRGEGAGLNWQEGVPMSYEGNDRWSWKGENVAQTVVCQVYLNDEIAAFGEDITLAPGQTLEITPSFPKVEA